MNLYVIRKKSLENIPITQSFSVDIGINTLGICLINREEIKFAPIIGDYHPTSLAFPQLYQVSDMVSSMLIKTMKGMNGGKFDDSIRVNIEYPLVGRGFSYGLVGVASIIAEKLRQIPQVSKLYFCPPSIPGFFLRSRKTSDKEVLSFIHQNYGDIGKNMTNPHVADSLLMATCCHYKWFVKRGVQNLREPEYNEILLEV